MALASDIVASYRAPRKAMRRILDRGASEGQAFALNFFACLIIFIAQWPRLSRDAFLNPEIPLEARLGGALMGVMMIAPLLFYGLAALSHLIAKPLRGKGDGLAHGWLYSGRCLRSGPFGCFTVWSPGSLDLVRSSMWSGACFLRRFSTFGSIHYVKPSRGRHHLRSRLTLKERDE